MGNLNSACSICIVSDHLFTYVELRKEIDAKIAIKTHRITLKCILNLQASFPFRNSEYCDKVQLPLCLIKHQDLNTYRGVEV
jgi:hypothetical protein